MDAARSRFDVEAAVALHEEAAAFQEEAAADDRERGDDWIADRAIERARLARRRADAARTRHHLRA